MYLALGVGPYFLFRAIPLKPKRSKRTLFIPRLLLGSSSSANAGAAAPSSTESLFVGRRRRAAGRGGQNLEDEVQRFQLDGAAVYKYWVLDYYPLIRFWVPIVATST